MTAPADLVCDSCIDPAACRDACARETPGEPHDVAAQAVALDPRIAISVTWGRIKDGKVEVLSRLQIAGAPPCS